ncbi:hypothetical protein C8Q72DRAFT_800305, partial [Fomitopsis betulina]
VLIHQHVFHARRSVLVFCAARLAVVPPIVAISAHHLTAPLPWTFGWTAMSCVACYLCCRSSGLCHVCLRKFRP